MLLLVLWWCLLSAAACFGQTVVPPPDTAAVPPGSAPAAPAAPPKNFRFGTELCIVDSQVPVHEVACGTMILFRLATLEERVKVLDGTGQVVDCGGKQLRFIKVQQMGGMSGWALESELTNRCLAPTTVRASLVCGPNDKCPDESFKCVNGACLADNGRSDSASGELDMNSIIYIAVGAGGGGLCCLVVCVLLLACFVMGNRKKSEQRALDRQVPPSVAQQFMMTPQQQQMQQQQMFMMQQQQQMQPGFNSGSQFDPAWGGPPTMAQPINGHSASFHSARDQPSFDYPSQSGIFDNSQRPLF